MVSSDGWTLVDLREPGSPTVLFRGGRVRHRTSLSRALVDAAGTRRAREITNAVSRWADAAEHAAPEHLEFDGVECRPVDGPAGRIRAAWLATQGSVDAEPPAAVAFDWDVDARLFRAPAGAGVLVGRPQVEVRESGITSADALRFVEVDDTLGLVQAMLTDAPMEWSGSATLRRPDGPVAAVASLVPAAAHRGLSGVLFEVSGAPATTPVESMAMSTVARMSNVHVVVMDVSKMRVLRWLTDPPAGVAWKGQRDNRDTPHPDDVARIFVVAAAVLDGSSRRGELEDIRLRRQEGGWLVVDAVGELVAGSDPPLLIISMIERGTSDEPDPVPVDDDGHPGL
ncbi:hypothetical protein [Williamsia sp.]|uniref:hypothetical protein n=1 Tax=Williamsia sp. TaxID=1872085 RepID=UPI001A33A935|nr:hypothetical protein [Williamsia sp.]MBJ7291335.1 hypothetical protein [Williamsia sp.]